MVYPTITYTMLCRRLIAIYIRSFGLARRRMQGCHGSKASQRAIQLVALREVLFAVGALAALKLGSKISKIVIVQVVRARRL
jgi:hypothetical protein